MIAVIQRVSQAAITIDGEEIARIEKGVVVLLGVMVDDTQDDANYLANKILNFRIFNDADDKMNLAINDVGGEILVISQFTLCADWLKGRRPSFIKAAPPEDGEKLYQQFVANLKDGGIGVKTGQFGAMMDVALINNGPVTFVLDSALKR